MYGEGKKEYFTSFSLHYSTFKTENAEKTEKLMLFS
nr:MAG TPA: hypothetical protein [Caudoviricetes sp.]